MPWCWVCVTNVHRVGERRSCPSKERGCKSNHAKCRNSNANQMDVKKKENGMKRLETHTFHLASQRPSYALEPPSLETSPQISPGAATQPPPVCLEAPPHPRVAQVQSNKKRWGLAAAPRWMTNAFHFGAAQNRIGRVGWIVGINARDVDGSSNRGAFHDITAATDDCRSPPFGSGTWARGRAVLPRVLLYLVSRVRSDEDGEGHI